MQTHPKTSASQTQLYLDADGNAAIEFGNRLLVVLNGSFTQTRMIFKDATGPTWTNAHANVRLDSKGNLNFHAGANHVVLRPVAPKQRHVALVHYAKPIAFVDSLHAFAEAHRSGHGITWQSNQDLAAGIPLVATR